MNSDPALQSVMDSMRWMPLPCALLNPVSRQIVFANSAFQLLIQNHALTYGERLLADDALAQQAIEQCIQSGESVPLCLPTLTKELQLVPLFSAGKLMAVQCHALLARPANIGVARLRLQQKMQDFINHTSVHIWLAKPEGEVFWINDPLKRYLYGNQPMEDGEDARWITSIHPQDINRTNGWFLNFMLHGEPAGVDFRLMGSDGVYRWFYTTAQVMKSASQKPLYCVGITVNVDDFKRKESQQAHELEQVREEHRSDLYKMSQMQHELVTVQKRELVEYLASGVSHDLNNLLFIMNLSSNMLRQRVKDEQALTHLESIHKTIKKAGQLASQLVSFSARKPQDAELLHPREMMADIESLLRNAVGDDVQLSIVLAEDLGMVQVDRGYFENALINLTINARDAVRRKGEVQIRFFNHRAAFGADMRDYVALEVSDNGMGMSDEVQARIFEPFYSTKPAGEGTGLGMPMVHGFVRQSNGHIEVESALGQGSSIRLYLPRSDQQQVQQSTLAPPARATGESLLIVEDDLFVRESLAHVLHELGYKVSTAVNIDLALKYLRTGLQVDLVMVDVRQTYGAAALDMADALAAEGMHLPILLTGSSTSANFSAIAATGPSAGVLCKPFSIHELSLKIRQILHSEDQTANTF